jgi:hypothetical protein
MAQQRTAMRLDETLVEWFFGILSTSAYSLRGLFLSQVLAKPRYPDIRLNANRFRRLGPQPLGDLRFGDHE